MIGPRSARSRSTDITKGLELKMRSTLMKNVLRIPENAVSGQGVTTGYFPRVALHFAPPALPSIELPFTRPVYCVPPAVKVI